MPGHPTGELGIPPTLDVPETDRGVMPRRKQTREQDRRDHIAQERRERTELIAEEERQRQAWLAANYEPPPFRYGVLVCQGQDEAAAVTVVAAAASLSEGL